jgi:hypothetical protein
MPQNFHTWLISLTVSEALIRVINFPLRKWPGWGCDSMVEHLPSMRWGPAFSPQRCKWTNKLKKKFSIYLTQFSCLKVTSCFLVTSNIVTSCWGVPKSLTFCRHSSNFLLKCSILWFLMKNLNCWNHESGPDNFSHTDARALSHCHGTVTVEQSLRESARRKKGQDGRTPPNIKAKHEEPSGSTRDKLHTDSKARGTEAS